MAIAIFVSTFLWFQVQPLISWFIMALCKGGPTVWTRAMLFFQCIGLGVYA
jgi:hypothetical protein